MSTNRAGTQYDSYQKAGAVLLADLIQDKAKQKALNKAIKASTDGIVKVDPSWLADADQSQVASIKKQYCTDAFQDQVQQATKSDGTSGGTPEQQLTAGLQSLVNGANSVAEAGHKFTLADLTQIATKQVGPNGKKVPAAQKDFVAAARLLVQNPAVFQALARSMPNMDMPTDGFTAADLKTLLGGGVLPNGHKMADVLGALKPTPTPPVVPPNNLPRVEINDMPPAQRLKFAQLYHEWGATMVKAHEGWHKINGPGGTKGDGSGEMFIQFHANMDTDFVAYVKQKAPELLDKNGNLPYWDTSKDLPPEFWTATPPLAKHGIGWRLPGFLTAAGNAGPPPETFTIHGRTISSLNDIKSIDELGQIWGLSGAHGVAHNVLGGEMAGYASVEDPAFMLWHFGVIEGTRAAWYQTQSGKDWLAAHPSGFTDPNANQHMGEMGGTMKMAMEPLSEQDLQKVKDAPSLWPMGEIFEAGVGFLDPAMRAEAAKNVKRVPTNEGRLFKPDRQQQ